MPVRSQSAFPIAQDKTSPVLLYNTFDAAAREAASKASIAAAVRAVQGNIGGLAPSTEKPPPGWTKYQSRSYGGKPYYMSKNGRVSQWERPTDEYTSSAAEEGRNAMPQERELAVRGEEGAPPQVNPFAKQLMRRIQRTRDQANPYHPEAMAAQRRVAEGVAEEEGFPRARVQREANPFEQMAAKEEEERAARRWAVAKAAVEEEAAARGEELEARRRWKEEQNAMDRGKLEAAVKALDAVEAAKKAVQKAAINSSENGDEDRVTRAKEVLKRAEEDLAALRAHAGGTRRRRHTKKHRTRGRH
jgi:hypothetical protein